MELQIVKAVSHLAGRSKGLDHFLYSAARYGHWAFVLYGIVLWLAPGSDEAVARRRRSAVKALLTVLLVSTVSFFIGKAWKRERPFVQDPSIPNPTGHKGNASFPSNHTANAMAVSFQLLRDHLPGAGLLTLWGVVVAFSRVFSGVHFPSDLAGGALLAAAVHQMVNRLPFLAQGASILAAAGTAAQRLLLSRQR